MGRCTRRRFTTRFLRTLIGSGGLKSSWTVAKGESGLILCQAPTHDYRAYRIYCVLYVNFSRSGFLREDGTFAVSGLPTGSYVVEVVNADYYYEPVRVDINSKGKMRARKVNNVQPTQVKQCCFLATHNLAWKLG